MISLLEMTFDNIENSEDNFDSDTNNNDSEILPSLINESMTENTFVKFNSSKEI